MIVAAQHMPVAPVQPTTTPGLVRLVEITDSGYVPGALVVAPSTDVSWHNAGRNRHTVTADDGAFGSRTLFTGDDFRITAPASPGVYAYHCEFHSYIRGTLTVSLVALIPPEPVDVGGSATIAGSVPGAAAGTPVRVELRAPGSWVTVADTTTDAAGIFSVRSPALTGRTAFRAVAAGTLSPSIRAEVRPVVAVRRTGRRLTVRVRPAVAGAVVGLQRLDLDTYRWGEVATRRVTGGQARFTLGSPGVYRAEVGARGGLSARASKAVEFRPGAFRQ